MDGQPQGTRRDALHRVRGSGGQEQIIAGREGDRHGLRPVADDARRQGGALAGGAIGAYQDRQEADLRRATAGTGVDVTRDGDVIKLNLPDGVTFDFAKWDVKPQFFPALNTIASTLKEYNQTIVEVSGHTDSIGSDAANQTLSERRANSVANYLIGQGLLRQRFEIVGMGERYPIASNDTDSGRAMNRRVEIRLLPLQG